MREAILLYSTSSAFARGPMTAPPTSRVGSAVATPDAILNAPLSVSLRIPSPMVAAAAFASIDGSQSGLAVIDSHV